VVYGGVPASSNCSTTEGYPCVDQIGRGQSIGTSPNMTQISDPVYLWGNNLSAAGTAVVGTPSGYVNANRDFFYNQGAKPGFAAYPYPHPLVSGDPAPPSPPPPSPGSLVPSPPSIIGVN
jgi:hypothetical protein